MIIHSLLFARISSSLVLVSNSIICLLGCLGPKFWYYDVCLNDNSRNELQDDQGAEGYWWPLQKRKMYEKMIFRRHTFREKDSSVVEN